MAKWVLDPTHSAVTFSARHMMVTTVRGNFKLFSANIDFDPANPQAGSVSAEIDASSIDTSVADRDGHLKSPDFFDVEKHPSITFKSVSVASTGANKLDITGDLTVRGTTKRIIVPATMMFYEQGTGRFRGTFTINRMDYGVNYDSKLNPIQPEVQVQWDIALSEPKPAAK